MYRIVYLFILLLLLFFLKMTNTINIFSFLFLHSKALEWSQTLNALSCIESPCV